MRRVIRRSPRARPSPLAAAALGFLVASCAAQGPGAISAAGPRVSVPTPVRPSSAAAAGRQPTIPPRVGDAAGVGSALRLLAGLHVQGRGPKIGYRREEFGPAWADTDRNGCDTRNDVLRRDLDRLAVRSGTAGCVAVAGTLTDPYTGRSIPFSKAAASAVQIDHVVALSDAWQKGAGQWPYGKRVAFANDPLNLLAVDGPANMIKGDSDAASWLPANKVFRCPYAARQVAVKAKYTVSVTAAERDALARVLARCPAEVAPVGGGPTAAGWLRPASPARQAPPAGTADRRMPSCRAAIAAGYGPYRRGADVEYGWYRDGDADGTVCER